MPGFVQTTHSRIEHQLLSAGFLQSSCRKPCDGRTSFGSHQAVETGTKVLMDPEVSHEYTDPNTQGCPNEFHRFRMYPGHFATSFCFLLVLESWARLFEIKWREKFAIVSIK
jgi:hypothetical protein